jgi:DNA-directed RNA polymerase alpha subunit
MNIIEKIDFAIRVLHEAKSEVEKNIKDNPILKMSIDKLDISVRLENLLKSEGILSVAELTRISPYKLRSIPNLGPRSFNEIERALLLVGLHVGGLNGS